MRIALCFLAVILIGNLPAQPNVLMIVADDLGWGDLSANGNRDVETPQLDALSETGLKFEKFYVCPNGSTTSASLLTGRYHYRTGVVGESGAEAMMYGSEKTIGEIFAENGYRTGYFGEWLHGENWPQNVTGQGFADFEGSAVEFLQQDKPEPFLCLVKLSDPKLKSIKGLTPEQRLAKVNQGIAKVDREVGELLNSIARENTIVIFLSDNGPDQFGKTEGRYNGYFYGGKGSVHEGGIRVPCFVSWPGKIEAGSRFTRISAHIDWYPTLIELCGLESKSRQLRIDGSSLAPVLLDAGNSENWPNRILFTSWTPPGYAIKKASVSVRTDRWVALRDPRWRRDESVVEQNSGWELYDLKTDPFQSREKSGELPFLLSELRADFSFWMDHTTDDGIGPLAIHIGHPQWPVVTFRPNPEMSWPVRIIEEGKYIVEVKFPEGENKCQLSFGDHIVNVSEPVEIDLTDNITSLKIEAGNIISLKIRN